MAERVGRWRRPAELDLEPLHGDVPEVLERVDHDETSPAQDRDAVGDAFDL